MERKRLAIASAEAAPGTATLSTALSIDLPQKVTTENLSETFSKLAAAVPDTVGHDQRARVPDRNVIQGAMRVVEAIRDYAPQNPWERGSALLEQAERATKAPRETRADQH